MDSLGEAAGGAASIDLPLCLIQAKRSKSRRDRSLQRIGEVLKHGLTVPWPTLVGPTSEERLKYRFTVSSGLRHQLAIVNHHVGFAV